MPRTAKPKVAPYEGNMAIVRLEYMDYVMPYADGLALIKSLENAEFYEDKYQEGKAISRMKNDTIKITILSKEEYMEIKMNQLLGITDG